MSAPNTTTPPTLGGLTWSPFVRTDGQTAWNAANPNGGYFYLAPGGTLYDVPQAGRFTAAQANGPGGVARYALGQASTYFANVFSNTNPAPSTSATNTQQGQCASGDSVCQLAGIIAAQQAAGAPQTNLGSILGSGSTGTDGSGSLSDLATPVTYPTTTTSGPNPLAYILLLAAAGLFFWWWKTRKADKGSPADVTGHG